MGQLAVPMMIGAAVGGGTKLLQGKGIGSILKGAALGGAMGGATGGIGGLMSEGAVAGAEGVASQGAGGLLGATGAAGTGASLAPSIATDGIVGSSLGETVGGANFMMPTQQLSGEIGMANAFDPLTGEVIKTAPNVDSMYSSMMNDMPSGGGMFARNSGMAADGTLATRFGDLKDIIGKYGTIDNLQGAAQVASMYQPQPMQAAPAGRIEVGQAPTGAIYDALRQTGYTLPKRRETNFSLIG
jgi:hypothetical protein